MVSNHTDRRAAEWHGIPFPPHPRTAATKPRRRPGFWNWWTRIDVELVVLARYMQVLSDDLARPARRQGHQHPPLLPAQLQGRQAVPPGLRARVKTVGATAHYVNAELDEGPIIAQQVIEVDHTYGPADLVAAGTGHRVQGPDECCALAREGRIILSGNRTVILR